MANEIELKLSLPHRSVAALRRHPLIVACPKAGNAVTLENIYYDTPELALKKARVGLRTRRQGRRWLQTVKSAAISTAGLSSRPEWEQPYGGEFDFSNVDDARVRKLLLRHAPTLIPVFSTRFRRETRIHAPKPGVEIHLMLDIGEVTAGERTEPLCELELELMHGNALDLLRFAIRLTEDLPLLPDDRSKAERGYRLHLGSPPGPARAQSSTVHATMNPLDAFRELAFANMRQWQANVAGALGDDAPEFIHQLRISQRRLRSLTRLFATALPADFVTDWSARLKANAGHFGEARDFDVLDEEILAPVSATDTVLADSLAKLRNRATDSHNKARRAADKALDAAEQGRLLLTLAENLLNLPDNELIRSVDLPSFAALQLEKLRKRVRKRHRAALDRAPEHLHALRIAFKQLRYGVEFFTPLLPTRTTARYVKELTRVQNALGFIQDLDTACRHFSGWAETDPELAPGAAYIAGWHAPRRARMTKRALNATAPLLKADQTPWAELRK